MTVYLIFAFLPMGLWMLLSNVDNPKTRKTLFYIVCGTVFLFFMGCRDNSLGSTDTYYYSARMKYAIQCNTWEQFYNPDLYETGFQVFIFALSRIFHDPQWLLVITSLFYIISIFYFIDRNSEEVSLSTILYVTLGLMTFQLQGMRQAIAMCLCLFAYGQAKRKHLIKFLLLVSLACTFHQTAIVFVIVYWLSQLTLNQRNVLFVSAISIVGILLSGPLIKIANDIFDKNYSNSVDSGGFIAVALYIIGLIVSYFYYRAHEKGPNSSLVFILIVGTAIYLMRYTGVQVAERISFYFQYSQIILIPLTIKIFRESDRTITYLIIIALAIGLFLYRLTDSGFLPYRFFWN